MTEAAGNFGSRPVEGFAFSASGTPDPFLAMPAPTLVHRMVKMQERADFQVTLRDEMAERQRIDKAIGEILQRVRDAGNEIRTASTDWRTYPGDGLRHQTAVVT